MRQQILVATRQAMIGKAVCEYLRLRSSGRMEAALVTYTSGRGLLDSIETKAGKYPGDTLVIVDQTLEVDGGWAPDAADLDQGLAARLVLSFPDIHFVFLLLSEPTAQENEVLRGRSDHYATLGTLSHLFSCVQAHESGYRSLFDPSGLRAQLKVNLFDKGGVARGESSDRAPSRSRRLSESRLRHSAVVAEEEEEFAFLNGWATYKAGYRTYMARTLAEHERLIGPVDQSSSAGRKQDTPSVLVSDWELQYPDLRGDELDFEPLLVRTQLGSDLGEIVVVTSYPGAVPESLPNGVQIRTLEKPYGSVFELIRSIEGGDLARSGPEASRVTSPSQDATSGPLLADRHSAPFVHLQIAELLISRATDRANESTLSIRALVEQVVLAAEAKELLQGESRTTYLKALSLQQVAEVRAEAGFYGIAGAIRVRDRLDEIDEEAQIGGCRPGELQHDEFMMKMLGQLRTVLARHEQLAASEEVAREYSQVSRRLERPSFRFSTPKLLRDLRACLWAGQHQVSWWHGVVGSALAVLLAAVSLGGFVHGPLEGVLLYGSAGALGLLAGAYLWMILPWYIDLVTRSGTSIAHLLLASAFWVLWFSFVYGLGFAVQGSQVDFGNALWHSILSFLSVGVGDGELHKVAVKHPWYQVAFLGQIVIAYLHLGLLIAQLYRRMMRELP